MHSEMLALAICEGKDRTSALLGLVVLEEEKYEEDCVQEICKHEVPEGVVRADHSVPEEEAYQARTSKGIQILRSEAFGISVLPQMNQLRNQSYCFKEHGEGDKHLEGNEIFTFASWVEH